MSTKSKKPAKKIDPKNAESQPAKPASPNKPTKKLSQIEAALQVLKNAKEPMSCKQIVEAMVAKKLWTSPGGKTPEATLYASLLRELAKKGDAARFVKAAPGRFAAKV